jgi:hypothetical protein
MILYNSNLRAVKNYRRSHQYFKTANWNNKNNVKFEFLVVVNIKMTVCWPMMMEAAGSASCKILVPYPPITWHYIP